MSECIQKESPWISVKDRLPTKEDGGVATHVIIHGYDKKLGAVFTGVTPWHHATPESWYSHWMPVPELPKPIDHSTPITDAAEDAANARIRVAGGYSSAEVDAWDLARQLERHRGRMLAVLKAVRDEIERSESDMVGGDE